MADLFHLLDLALSPMTDCSSTTLLVTAAVLHLTQPLVMGFAEKYLKGWSTEGELAPFALLARRVMRATIGSCLLGLTIIILSHFEEASSLRVGRYLLVLWAAFSVWVLGARLRPGSEAAQFRRERLQILVVVTSLGMLVGTHAQEVATTALGTALVSGLWLLWTTRALLESFVYRKIYPARRAFRLWNVFGTLLFFTQSALFGAVRLRSTGGMNSMISTSYVRISVKNDRKTESRKHCNNAPVKPLGEARATGRGASPRSVDGW